MKVVSTVSRRLWVAHKLGPTSSNKVQICFGSSTNIIHIVFDLPKRVGNIACSATSTDPIYGIDFINISRNNEVIVYTGKANTGVGSSAIVTVATRIPPRPILSSSSSTMSAAKYASLATPSTRPPHSGFSIDDELSMINTTSETG